MLNAAISCCIDSKPSSRWLGRDIAACAPSMLCYDDDDGQRIG